MKLHLILTTVLLTKFVAGEISHYEIAVKAQENEMSEIVDMQVREHTLADLEHFYLGDLSFEEKTHSEALKLLGDKYKEICKLTGEKPLEINWKGIPEGGIKLSHRNNGTSFLSAVKMVNLFFGKDSIVDALSNTISVVSFSDEKALYTKSHDVPPDWGLLNYESHEGVENELNKIFNLGEKESFRFISEASSLVVYGAKASHQKVALYNSLREVSKQLRVRSLIFETDDEKGGDHTKDILTLCKEKKVTQKPDFRRQVTEMPLPPQEDGAITHMAQLPSVVCRSGQAVDIEKLKVDLGLKAKANNEIWTGQKLKVEVSLIGFSTILEGSYSTNTNHAKLEIKETPIRCLYRDDKYVSFKLDPSQGKNRYIRMGVSVIDASGKKADHYLATK